MKKDWYPQAGEGDDELADAAWKKKRGWTKLWDKMKDELSGNTKRKSKKRKKSVR